MHHPDRSHRTRQRRKLLLLLCLASTPLMGATSQGSAVAAAAVRAASAPVQPGDQIVLKVLREEDLSVTAEVNERGDAVFPRIGTLPVATLTIAGLRDTLQQRYAKLLRDPDVDVSVLRRIAVVGEVRNPGVFHVTLTSRLRDVIAEAGGITEQGRKNGVAIVRDGSRIAVPDWESDLTLASDLRSGDQVTVERKSWFAINAIPIASMSLAVVSLIVSLRR